MYEAFPQHLSHRTRYSQDSDMEGNPPEMVALEKQLGQAKAKLRDAQNDEERTRQISELSAEKELNRSDLLRLENGLKVPEHHCIGIRKNLDDYMMYRAQSTSQIHNSNLTCAISNLPDELLHSIFSYAIPPAFLLDPSIVRGPQSSWSRVLRLKKSFVQVCRVWYTVGMTFLYQDIVFRRVHQIPSFLRTIESSPALFGSMVKTIAFSAFVPEKFAISFSEQVQRIIGLSPHVTRILFDPVFPLPPIAAMPVMPRNVIHLAFGIQVQYISILPILLHASESLHSLSLVFDDLDVPSNMPPHEVVDMKDEYAYRTPGLNLRHDVGLVYAAPVPGPGLGYEIGCTGSTISAKVRDETEMMADEWESDVGSEVGEYRREYESYLDEREYFPSESESESESEIEEMEEDAVSEAADSDEQVILNAISEGYN